MRKTLFLILFGLHLISAQQNEFFREVKKHFDDREIAMILQYKKLYQKATEPDREKLNAEFTMLQYRMRDARNNAYLEALLKTKIQEDLGKLKIDEANIVRKPSQYTAPSQYPTGMDGLRKEIIKEFHSESIFLEGEFSTRVRFVVERDGYVSQVEAVGEHNVFNQRAEIAVYLLSQKFTPAYHGGSPIRSYHTLPIKIKLQ